MSDVIGQLVVLLTTVLTVAIVVRSLLSWFPIDPKNPLSTVVNQLTEPILGPLRRVLPRMGTFDLTPIIALLLIFLIRSLLLSALP